MGSYGARTRGSLTRYGEPYRQLLRRRRTTTDLADDVAPCRSVTVGELAEAFCKLPEPREYDFFRTTALAPASCRRGGLRRLRPSSALRNRLALQFHKEESWPFRRRSGIPVSGLRQAGVYRDERLVRSRKLMPRDGTRMIRFP